MTPTYVRDSSACDAGETSARLRLAILSRIGEVAASGAREELAVADADADRPPGPVGGTRIVVAERVLLVQLLGDPLGSWTEFGGAPHDLGVATAQTGHL